MDQLKIDGLHFNGSYPKCNSNGSFSVVGVSSDNESQYFEAFEYNEWREYDFFLFSVSSICPNCKHYITANIAAIYDEEKNATASLNMYCESDGELINNKNLLIEFDFPPLLPSQSIQSPMKVNIFDLYTQAKRCYSIHAWDAVGVLCRKIIDVSSAEAWKAKFGIRKPPNLFNRVLKLLTEKDEIDTSKELDEQFDFSIKKHKLLYDLTQIRLLGNEAAHSQIVFGSEDAEASLIYTKSFLIEEKFK